MRPLEPEGFPFGLHPSVAKLEAGSGAYPGLPRLLLDQLFEELDGGRIVAFT